MVLTKERFICENISRNEAGELCFADVEVAKLAEKYGTPLYLYDEERIRERCRTYLSAVEKAGKHFLDPVIADHAADIFHALKEYKKAVEYGYKALEYYSSEVDAVKVMNKIKANEKLLKNRNKE